MVAALKRLGFEEVRQKGSHLVLPRTTTAADGSAAAVICVVPLHRRDLAVGTLAIELADRATCSPEAVSDNLIVDTGVLGKPVGMTLEHDSQIAGISTTLTLLPITPVLQPA